MASISCKLIKVSIKFKFKIKVREHFRKTSTGIPKNAL